MRSQINDLRKKEANNEREKAAAFAHFGKTRKLAVSVRRRIEKSVMPETRCPYCCQELGIDWRADHIYPVAHGGLSTLDNMIAVCLDCNSKKSDKMLREFVRTMGYDLEAIELLLQELGKRF